MARTIAVLADDQEIHAGARGKASAPRAIGKRQEHFLSLLAGIVAAEQGRIDVLGTDMAKLSGSARDRFRVDHFGIIFQMFNLLPLRVFHRQRAAAAAVLA